MKTYAKNIFILSILLLSNILNANEYLIRTNFANLLEFTIFVEEVENSTTVLDLKNRIIEHIKNNNIYLVGYDFSIINNAKILNNNDLLASYKEKTFNFIVENFNEKHTYILENETYGNYNINFKINITDEYKEKYLQNMLFQILKEKNTKFNILSRADFLNNIKLTKKDSEISKYQYEQYGLNYYKMFYKATTNENYDLSKLNKISVNQNIKNNYTEGSAMNLTVRGRFVTGKYLKDVLQQTIIDNKYNITHFNIFSLNNQIGVIDDNKVLDTRQIEIICGIIKKCDIEPKSAH